MAGRGLTWRICCSRHRATATLFYTNAEAADDRTSSKKTCMQICMTGHGLTEEQHCCVVWCFRRGEVPCCIIVASRSALQFCHHEDLMVVKANREDVQLRSKIKAGAPGDDLAMIEAKYLDRRTGLCSTHQCKVYPRVFRVHNLQIQAAFVFCASYLDRAQKIHSKNRLLAKGCVCL